MQRRSAEKSTSKQELNTVSKQSETSEGNIQTKPTQSSETILDCLLRLHKQSTLYNGASHIATTLMISNFIFFYTLQVCKRSLGHLQTPNFQQSQSNTTGCLQRRKRCIRSQQFHIFHNILHQILESKMATSLLSSTIAGMINVLLTNPLWVVSLRTMEDKTKRYEKQPNIWSTMRQIARSEGIQQLWSGTWTSLLLVSNPIIQHFVYEQLRSCLLELKQRQPQSYNRGAAVQMSILSPLQAFIFGAMAKAVATVLTYPLQLAQVLIRLQKKQIDMPTEAGENADEQNTNVQRSYTGAYDCLHHQFRQGGVSALFVGMNAKMLQTVLTSAFTFLTYEQTLASVAGLYKVLK